jgi:hypothetical protein
MRSETSRGPPFLPTMSRSRYTLQVPNRRSPKSATSEHVFVCRRYVSMESLAISASIARRGRGRGSTADTKVRHHSSRSGTGKGDRLCRSEPINPSGSSASASLASWPAWPTAAAAPCWPGDGARDAMLSPSRKRTSSRRIARRLACAVAGLARPLPGA